MMSVSERITSHILTCQDIFFISLKVTIGIREAAAGLSMDIRHILIQLEMVSSLISEIEDEMEIALGRITL
ncbi:MAG: hypothetical protein A2V87_11500 [Deltaproteobacteria bacterium RBG_16_58_17]|nr:MAG: hypothetical protein A2V87_11500 [Deltaproteobacteria bacterium RBG_16_58_17]OHE19748.1 MAG: hypothetical protein A2X95_03910 [Syntrophobacterales bacterium GWF2_56_9]